MPAQLLLDNHLCYPIPLKNKIKNKNVKNKLPSAFLSQVWQLKLMGENEKEWKRSCEKKEERLVQKKSKQNQIEKKVKEHPMKIIGNDLIKDQYGKQNYNGALKEHNEKKIIVQGPLKCSACYGDLKNDTEHKNEKNFHHDKCNRYYPMYCRCFMYFVH